MPYLRDAEVRRLLAYLRRQITDTGRLAEIEDILRSEETEEFLREPNLLAYFPALTESFAAGGVAWRLRLIPHAHLRSIQRGLPVQSIVGLFRRFVDYNQQQGASLTPGAYTITGRPAPRERTVTLRVDVDEVSDTEGAAHVVTVVIGLIEAIDEDAATTSI